MSQHPGIVAGTAPAVLDRAANRVLRFTEFGPPADLADWIECIAIVEIPHGIPKRSWRLVPDVRGRCWLPITGDTRAAFYAGTTRFRDVAAPAAGRAAVVRFGPWVGQALAGWWSGAACTWGMRPGPDEWTAAADWLRRVLPAERPDARAIQVWRLLEVNPHLDVQHLAEMIGTSARTLRRVTRAAAGCSVRTAAQLERFRAALRLLRSDLRLSWTDAALSAGYCDQSHLYRAFDRWVGMAPGRFFGEGHHHMNDAFARQVEPSDRTRPVRARGAPSLRPPSPARALERDRRRARRPA